MNFKKYHVSRNLFDKSTWNGVSAQRGTIEAVTNGFKLTATGDDCYSQTYASIAPSCSYAVTSGETYTLSWNIDNPNIYGNVFVFSGVSAASSTLTSVTASSKKATFTIPSGHKYVSFRIGVAYSGDSLIYTDIMLNTGSTALPYEPYSSEVWHDTPHFIHNTSTDTITTLPAVLYPNATTATVGLKGQAVQSSTPTPDNPIMPDGCGERTGNLLDKTGFTGVSATIEQIKDGIRVITQSGGYAARIVLDVLKNTDYTVSYIFKIISGSATNTVRVFAGTGSSTEIASFSSKTNGTFNTGNNAKINIWFYAAFGTTATVEYTNIMLNRGSTALPYEPYGYKISISSAGQTTPIYLGEVQTTRKIKKYEFTGTEALQTSGSGNTRFFYMSIADARNWATVISDRYVNANIASTTEVIGVAMSGNSQFRIRPDLTSTVNDFKAYLAQQYANGSPVTIWYVLTESETGIVNEPLMRIGDYADTLSNVPIPVTAGGDTLSVGTTVQPSEVTVNYKGWHPVADVHERDNGAWT